MYVGTTEYTEWQRPFSGVHSIIMEKLAQAGEGWGVHAHPYKVVVDAPAERAGTLPLFLLCPYMYSVVGTGKNPLSEYRHIL
jgi:hypothetical protein